MNRISSEGKVHYIVSEEELRAIKCEAYDQGKNDVLTQLRKLLDKPKIMKGEILDLCYRLK